MSEPDPLAVDLADGVGAAFLTRSGGVSSGRFASLNLGLHVGDATDSVLTNRARAAEAVGVDAARVTWAAQVHGNDVAVVSDSDAGRGAVRIEDAVPGVDSLVTSARALPLAVLVADCVPVLMADARSGAIAAAHAGRRGLLTGVVQATVTRLTGGGSPDAVRVVLGPHIGACCYEVGPDVHAESTATMPALAARSSRGRPALDLAVGVRQALADSGVGAARSVGGCTACQPDLWFSYRRDGVTGRSAGLVWLR